MRDTLLNSAIESKCQWNEALINTVCTKHNLTLEEFKLIFPKGVESLADEFFKRVDQEMLNIITNEFLKLPIHIQVTKLLEARLNYMSQNKKVLLKILRMKCSLTYQISHVSQLSHLIWSNVNHQSSGFDYYTRRIILANLYKDCLFFFKKDVSAEKMIIFCQKKLQSVGRITQLKKKLCKIK